MLILMANNARSADINDNVVNEVNAVSKQGFKINNKNKGKIITPGSLAEEKLESPKVYGNPRDELLEESLKGAQMSGNVQKIGKRYIDGGIRAGVISNEKNKIKKSDNSKVRVIKDSDSEVIIGTKKYE